MLVEKEAYKGSQKTDVQKLYSQTGEGIIFNRHIFGRIRYLIVSVNEALINKNIYCS